MTLANKTIAILHHDQPRTLAPWYLVGLMRRVWEGQGAKVIDLFGVQAFLPADIVLVHVDLSIVPAIYREFAQQYPLALNLAADDIRKSGYCPHLLHRGDEYDGPVIVKTDLNSAGKPEMRASPGRFSLLGRIWGRTQTFRRAKSDYRIFSSLADVPDAYFSNDFVVQKFLPEMRDGEYVLREYYFLDGAEFHNVEVGPHPVMTTGSQIHTSTEPAHPKLRELRRLLNLDYGKIDYVLAGGEPVIFDANKTIGTRRNPTAATWELARHLAAGLS